MKHDYTHITVILDRTGSMESIRDDTIGGFNAFLKKQKAESGTATLTLVQFDTKDPYEVIHRFKPIKAVPNLNRKTYVPRAGTPLLDAIGHGINDLDKSIADLKEKNRPSKVIVVVVTDGQENSSREFRKDQIEKMVKEKTKKNSWQFVFLSADLAAIGDAIAVGIHPDAVLLYEKSGKGSAGAWASLSARTSDYRTSRKKEIGFEQDDRKHSDDPARHKALGKMKTSTKFLPVIPSVEEYKTALLAVRGEMTDKHLKMLRAHFRASDHTITARKMAEAVGFPNYNAANLQYGTFGRLLCVRLRRRLKYHVAILADFEGGDPGSDPELHWVMLPQLVQALTELGWVR